MLDRIELPSLETLKQYLQYDAVTGIVTWKMKPCNRVKIGEPLGWYVSNGYLAFGLNGKSYLLHRAIWKLVTGKEPPYEIDHENTITDDNRWNNLRPATRHTNLANSSKSIANTSGVKGVNWHKRMRKWRARIMVNRKDICIGYFDKIEEAAEARKKYAIALHGEYAREG